MRVKRLPMGDVVVLSDEAAGQRAPPSVDVLFHSVARGIWAAAVAVLMTGMGDDGAEGSGCGEEGRRHDHRAERRIVRGVWHAEGRDRAWLCHARGGAWMVLASTLQALCGRE